MLTLLIDNQRVNLPADMSTDYYVLNPFFSKEGEHTYDIDINLHDPQNALIYKNIHRIDIVSHPTNRKALMYNEYGVLVRGTEIILEINEHQAKIQLVAGNSELNYKIGDDKYLTDLDLGRVNISSISDAEASQKGSYPTYDYVCTPVCAFNDSDVKQYDMLDKDRLVTEGDTTKVKYVILNNTDGSTGKISSFTATPQAYLAAIIKRIMYSLDYSIGENVFETDEKLKRLIIINAHPWYIGEDSAPQFNKLLPNWKVSDFISEVEKFANVIFDVNQMTHSVNIRHVYDFYNDLPLLYIPKDKIIGEVQKKYDQDEVKKLDMQYTNVKYNFPDDTYYKYQDLEEDLINDCTINNVSRQTWDKAYSRYNFADIWRAITGSNDFLSSESVASSVGHGFNTMVLYQAMLFTETLTFVLRSIDELYPCVRPCNQFAHKTTDENKDVTTLNIIPCEMVSSPVHYNGSASKMAQFPIPVAKWPYPTRTFVKKADPDVTTDLNKYIQDGYETEKNEGDTERIYVAFYFGVLPINWEDPDMGISGWNIPVASPVNETFLMHEKLGDVSNLFWKHCREINLGNEQLTLSIQGTYGWWNTSYSRNPSVDIDTEYVINLRLSEIPDPRRIFIIGNKKFYCKQLKYAIKNKQLSDIVEGTFYEVN